MFTNVPPPPPPVYEWDYLERPMPQPMPMEKDQGAQNKDAVAQGTDDVKIRSNFAETFCWNDVKPDK